MPYANFDDVQSIKVLYHQSLIDDDNMDVFEFVGEKLLTAGFDPFEQQETKNKHQHFPFNDSNTLQIQAGVLFQQVNAEIKIQQLKVITVQQVMESASFYAQVFHKGIFRPPLI